MDEQYPVRLVANHSRATSRTRRNDARSKPTSLISYKHRQQHNPSFNESVKSNRRLLLSSQSKSLEKLLIYKKRKTRSISIRVLKINVHRQSYRSETNYSPLRSIRSLQQQRRTDGKKQRQLVRERRSAVWNLFRERSFTAGWIRGMYFAIFSQGCVRLQGVSCVQVRSPLRLIFYHAI